MYGRSIGFAAAFAGWLLAMAATPSSLQATTLSAAGNHTCAIADGGAVKCWGGNYWGQLGNGSRLDSAVAVDVAGVTGATSLALGERHGCAIVEEGRVKCWGRNFYGQLGDDTTDDRLVAGDVSGLSGASAIAAGKYHTCAIVDGGALKCWGMNYHGELGNGQSGGTGLRPVDVLGISGASAIAAGDYHTCVILADRGMKCWGINDAGQLGTGGTARSPLPVAVTSIADAAGMATGANHTCAVLTGGQVRCWGYYDDGALSEFSSRLPTTIAGLAGVTALAAARGSTCALMPGGSVRCWGDNSDGQLGNGTLVGDLQPVAVSGIAAATQLAMADHHACAQLSGGSVKCWGSSASGGQVGNGARASASHAVVVPGLEPLVAAGAGAAHGCAVTSSGAVHCWGANTYGQLGDGGTLDRLTPGTVRMTEAAAMTSSGGAHSCALLRTGRVKCWGSAPGGALGDGSAQDSPLPVEVVGIADAQAITAGYRSCAIVGDGTLKCWGQADRVPRAVGGIAGAIAVSAGSQHACAVHGGGAVSCWGSNQWGQLGTNYICGANGEAGLQRVAGITDATAVAAGLFHTCAVVGGGAVKCWGYNGFGELGNADVPQSCMPMQAAGVTGASAVVVGSYHSCALVEGGAVKCWGQGELGQLGRDVGRGYGATAVAVPGVIDATALTAGDDHTCALLRDGSLKCWGYKGRGQLGNGSTAIYTTPQKVVGSPFLAGTSLFAFGDGGITSHGTALPFTVQLGQPASAASGSLRLHVMPSPSLVDPTWRCVAFGGALCPTLPAVGGALDLALELPAGSDLQFRLMTTADVSRGAFAEVTTRLESSTAADGMLTSTVTTLPIAPDGVFKGGFEATGQ